MANVADFIDDYNQMQDDAGRIIQKRVTMMLTGTMSGPEAFEMVAEKIQAIVDASFSGMACGMFGGDPLDIMAAMLAPYRRKTAINVARLSC